MKIAVYQHEGERVHCPAKLSQRTKKYQCKIDAGFIQGTPHMEADGLVASRINPAGQATCFGCG